MDDQELYRGFDRKIEDFFVAYEEREEEEFLTTLKNRELSSDDKQGLAKRANAIYREEKVFVDQGIAPDSSEVQRIIERHFHLLAEVHPVNRETYLAYARLYQVHPSFRAAFDSLDARLADFFARAMELYAQTVR